MAVAAWRPRSLQARQLWAASIALIALVALTGYALDRAFLDTAQSILRERLKSYVLAYAAETEFGRDGSIIPPYEPPDPRFKRPGSGLYAEIVLPDGRWSSTSAHGPDLPAAALLEPGTQRFEGPLPLTEINGNHGEAYRYGYGMLWPGDTPESGFRYTIYVLEDTTELRAQVNVFRRALWSYLGAGLLVMMLLQVLVLRWSLRPLRRVVGELQRVQRGQLTQMSPLHPRELTPLTESINALIESERENLARQRNTLADLAHSLKTPIAVLRARLDSGGGDAELRAELDTQLKRMGDMVSYQLSRAARSGHVLFAAPLPVEPEAEQIVRGLEKVYAGRGVLCEFEIAAEARFHGERGDLQELLGNLLENAFKWARSRVLLTAEIGEQAPNRRPGLRLVVDDDGPGIREDQVEHLLQRGVRGDERVQGHGIGLAMVQDIVRSYRGELHVGRAPDLGGARFEIVLPAGL